jgi:hypothetical protein
VDTHAGIKLIGCIQMNVTDSGCLMFIPDPSCYFSIPDPGTKNKKEEGQNNYLLLPIL